MDCMYRTNAAMLLQAGKPPDFFYCKSLLEEKGIVTVPGTGFKQAEGTLHFRTTILPPESDIESTAKDITDFHKDFMKKVLSLPRLVTAVCRCTIHIWCMNGQCWIFFRFADADSTCCLCVVRRQVMGREERLSLFGRLPQHWSRAVTGQRCRARARADRPVVSARKSVFLLSWLVQPAQPA